MPSAKGITLIETIIAVSILTLGIIGVLQAFPLGVHLTKTAQMATIATQLSQAKIEEEISRHYNEISLATITENYGEIPNFTAYKRITRTSCVRASDLMAADCDYDPTSDPYPMKKIEVTVYWRSSLGITEKNISLMGLVAQK